METSTVQIRINAFAPEMPLPQAVDMMASLLQRYAQATHIETDIY
jgi:hypothetical protein